MRNCRSYRNTEANGIVLAWICGALFFILAAIWPVFIWHGEGGPTGTDWEWDIRSTVACLIWWGVVIVVTVAAILVRANSPEVRAREKDGS